MFKVYTEKRTKHQWVITQQTSRLRNRSPYPSINTLIPPFYLIISPLSLTLSLA